MSRVGITWKEIWCLVVRMEILVVGEVRVTFTKVTYIELVSHRNRMYVHGMIPLIYINTCIFIYVTRNGPYKYTYMYTNTSIHLYMRNTHIYDYTQYWQKSGYRGLIGSTCGS